MSEAIQLAEDRAAFAEALADPRPRYRFTFDDVLAMVEAGVISQNADLELIDGELIQRSPENAPHRLYKRRFGKLLYERLDTDRSAIVIESALLLGDGDAPEPDLYVFPEGLDDRKLRGSDIDLAIEISDSTLRTDLVRKAKLYSSHGVPEYWVVDIDAKVLWQHRGPAQDGYQSIRRCGADDLVESLRLPRLAFRLSELKLDID